MRAVGDDMSSDFDLRTTLSEVYDEEQPDGESFVALLAAGTSLSSDFDARVLLEQVGARMPNTPEATTAYLDVAATINSDFDLRTALAPFVTREELDGELVARAIDLAGDEINSDFDLRVLLAEAAPRVGASDALARAYTEAVSAINSDFDHREALTALARARGALARRLAACCSTRPQGSRQRLRLRHVAGHRRAELAGRRRRRGRLSQRPWIRSAATSIGSAPSWRSTTPAAAN